MTIRSACLAATRTAAGPNAAIVSELAGGAVRSRNPLVLMTSPRCSVFWPARRGRRAVADSASASAVRSWRRPCHCRTTTGLDDPIATPTGRPVSSVSVAAPIAIMTGSRTATASGPIVRAACRVRSATTAARANASNVAISPIQISP